MANKDYYAILGVPKTATQDEIKKAYRKLARQYHPDVSTAPDAEQKIKEVNEAYDCLGNPDKRKSYDQFGGNPNMYGAHSQQQRQYQGQQFYQGAQFNMNDIFEQMFRQQAQQQQAYRQRQTEQRQNQPFIIRVISFIVRLLFIVFMIRLLYWPIFR